MSIGLVSGNKKKLQPFRNTVNRFIMTKTECMKTIIKNIFTLVKHGVLLRWMYNTLTLNGSDGFGFMMRRLKEEKFSIYRHFIFTITKQGHEFWNNIANKINK